MPDTTAMPDLCPGCGSDLTRDVCWCDHDDQPEPTIRHQNPLRAPQEARRATQTPPMDPPDAEERRRIIADQQERNKARSSSEILRGLGQ